MEHVGTGGFPGLPLDPELPKGRRAMLSRALPLDTAGICKGDVSMPGIDPRVANIARVYDWLLGGKDNIEADRVAGRALLGLMPDLRKQAELNRYFLGRAARFLAGRGIGQFLDLGSGLPTQDNLHQIVHRVAPDARVVYVDLDPVVVAHGRALLRAPGVDMVAGDVRDIKDILEHPDIRHGSGGLLDFGEPVAVFLVALLHFVADEDNPGAIMAAIRDALPEGSYVVVSHACADGMEQATAREAVALYRSSTGPITPRSAEAIGALFDGWELVDPGVVPVSRWRPDAELVHIGGGGAPRAEPVSGGVFMAGVAVKAAGVRS